MVSGSGDLDMGGAWLSCVFYGKNDVMLFTKRNLRYVPVLHLLDEFSDSFN